MERKDFPHKQKNVGYNNVDRIVIAIAARKINLDEFVRQYKLIIRRITKKRGVEPDLVKDDKDRIN